MVASGVPVSNGKEHAPEIAKMALEMRDKVQQYTIPHMPNTNLKMRIGIHSGLLFLISSSYLFLLHILMSIINYKN